MALLTDYHFHTEISPDSAAPWFDMVMAEYDAGMRYLCVTDHCDTVDWHTGAFSPRCLEIAGQERDMLARYGSRLPEDLHMRLGIELGESHLHPEVIPALTEPDWLDFILGSCHIAREYGDYYVQDYSDPAFREKLWDVYLADLQAIADWDFFDVMAHIGYWRRYAWLQGVDESLTLARHGDRVETLLRTIIQNGKGIELNCSGIRDGCGPFPSAELLGLYRRLGGEIITVGSDAHRVPDAAKCIREGFDLLRGLGFRYVTVFNHRKPEFIPIQ